MDTTSQVYYPWRRYLARMLDISIYTLIWSTSLTFIFNVNIANQSSILSYFNTIIAIVAMLFLEPLLLKCFGTTFGKWIFGLYLKNENGSNLSYKEGYNRTWGVIASGLGYYIPIYQLVRMWKSYKKCSENELQPWDYKLVYFIKDTKPYRGVVFVIVHILMFGVIWIILTLGQLPVNRGDLTIAEFAENYNRLSKYYGIETDKYLNEKGQWAQDPFEQYDGRISVEIFPSVLAEFEYITQNEHITSIRFELEIDNSGDWLTSSNNQMILAILSFVGAQNEVGAFSDFRRYIPKLVTENSFADFEITQANIQTKCDVEFSGYMKMNIGNEILIPDDDAEPYYHLVFSMDAIH